MRVCRKDYTDKKEIKRLDEANNQRYVDSVSRVAKAIDYIKKYREYFREVESEYANEILHDTARALSLLEVTSDEMKWHCEWFGYYEGVCDQIDEAIMFIGMFMADIKNYIDDMENPDKDKSDVEIELSFCNIEDALIRLSKAFATLIQWNDVDEDSDENADT